MDERAALERLRRDHPGRAGEPGAVLHVLDDALADLAAFPAARPDVEPLELLATVVRRRRARKAMGRCAALALVAPADNGGRVVVSLVTRDGWIGESAGPRGAVRSTDTGHALSTGAVEALRAVLEATGPFAARRPPAQAAPQGARVGDLRPAVVDLVDRYDGVAGPDRPPVLYTIEKNLQSGSAVAGRPDDHPLELLDRVLADPDGFEALRAAYLVALASTSWTFPDDVVDDIAQAMLADPQLDVVARFGTPAEHPRRVELGALIAVTRDGRRAALQRPRSRPGAPADGPPTSYSATDHGDALAGTIPDALGEAIDRTR